MWLLCSLTVLLNPCSCRSLGVATADHRRIYIRRTPCWRPTHQELLVTQKGTMWGLVFCSVRRLVINQPSAWRASNWCKSLSLIGPEGWDIVAGFNTGVATIQKYFTALWIIKGIRDHAEDDECKCWEMKLWHRCRVRFTQRPELSLVGLVELSPFELPLSQPVIDTLTYTNLLLALIPLFKDLMLAWNKKKRYNWMHMLFVRCCKCSYYSMFLLTVNAASLLLWKRVCTGAERFHR